MNPLHLFYITNIRIMQDITNVFTTDYYSIFYR